MILIDLTFWLCFGTQICSDNVLCCILSNLLFIKHHNCWAVMLGFQQRTYYLLMGPGLCVKPWKVTLNFEFLVETSTNNRLKMTAGKNSYTETKNAKNNCKDTHTKGPKKKRLNRRQNSSKKIHIWLTLWFLLCPSLILSVYPYVYNKKGQMKIWQNNM